MSRSTDLPNLRSDIIFFVVRIDTFKFVPAATSVSNKRFDDPLEETRFCEGTLVKKNRASRYFRRKKK